MQTNEKLIASFDLGGTFVKYGFINELGEIFQNGKFSTPDNINDLISKIKEVISNADNVGGITFSTPGNVNSQTGFISGLSMIPYIHNIDWFKIIKDNFGLPFAIENDANAGALGELWVGNLKECENGVFYIIGSGLGGAIIINNEIYKTRYGYSGEFGYPLMQKFDGNVSNNCSWIFVDKLLQAKLGYKLELIDAFEKYFDNDIVKQCIDKWVENNAYALLNIAFTVDPYVYVISGGVSNSELFIKLLNDKFGELVEATCPGREVGTVVAAKHKNNANILGAAYNYFNQ